MTTTAVIQKYTTLYHVMCKKNMSMTNDLKNKKRNSGHLIKGLELFSTIERQRTRRR